jgi:hypothetical protein
MSGLDAQHYRDEATKCQELAAQARDAATKEYWLEAARRWLTLANQADMATAFSPSLNKRQPSD